MSQSSIHQAQNNKQSSLLKNVDINLTYDSDKSLGKYTALTKTDIKDVINGAALLGAGGGGPKKIWYKMLEAIPDEQLIDLATIDDIEDHNWVVVAAFIGSADAAYNLKNVKYQSPTQAIKRLQQACGHTADFVAPVEIGAVNSIAPMLVSVDLDIPVVDADGAGRAVPTLNCLTFATKEELIKTGVAISNECSNQDDKQSAVFYVNNPKEAEELAAAAVQTSAYGNIGGIALWMMQGSDYKALAIRDGISNAKSIGKTLRTAKHNANGGHYDEIIVDHLNALDLKARIIKKSLKTQTFTTVTKTTLDHGELLLKDSTDTTYTVYIVNENIYAFKETESQPFIMSPDILCYLLEDGSTLDNSELQTRVKNNENLTLSLIGIEADAALKSYPSILDTFVKIYNQLGYTEGYIPFYA